MLKVILAITFVKFYAKKRASRFKGEAYIYRLEKYLY